MIRLLYEDKMIKFDGELSPKFGWCCIMSGGAGSGKGFVQKQVMDFDARVLDVDELKKLYVKAINSDKTTLGKSTNIAKRYYDFKNPDDVEELHFATKKYGEEQQDMYRHGSVINDLRRLQNVTFDITGKKPEETIRICEDMKNLGYKIMYVWVLTNREEAMVRNLMRDRVVPDDIFHQIHNAVNAAVPKFLQSSSANLIDDAWLVFSSLGYAGGDSDALKALADNRAIELKKSSSGFGFEIDPELEQRILDTLGEPEDLTGEDKVYMSQKDVLSRFKELGIEQKPDKNGKMRYSYSPKRPDRYGGLKYKK